MSGGVDRLLSISELAAELGVGRATLWRYRKQGLPAAAKKGKRYKYRLRDAIQWMTANGITGQKGGDRQTQVTGWAPPPEQAARKAEIDASLEDLNEEDSRTVGELSQEEIEGLRVDHLKARIRKEEAFADKHELEVQKRRGELVERAEVEQERVARVTYARTVLLGGPGILAGDLVGLGVEEIEERLGAWVRQALAHLQGGAS